MAGEILTQLNRIDSNIDAAFEKCRALGATMPSTINSDYLADTIETIPSSADIPVKTAADMTVSGATVTAPAGWYKQAASKAVATATQATPSISVNSSGLITAKTTQSAGYVAAGTKSGTKQLTTQEAKTVTPTTSEQTVVEAGVYTTGAVKVAKIPDSYIQPTGTKSITANGTHDVTSYASVEVNVPTSGGGGGGGGIEWCNVTVTVVSGGITFYGTGSGTVVLMNKVVYTYDTPQLVTTLYNAFEIRWELRVPKYSLITVGRGDESDSYKAASVTNDMEYVKVDDISASPLSNTYRYAFLVKGDGEITVS